MHIHENTIGIVGGINPAKVFTCKTTTIANLTGDLYMPQPNNILAETYIGIQRTIKVNALYITNTSTTDSATCDIAIYYGPDDTDSVELTYLVKDALISPNTTLDFFSKNIYIIGSGTYDMILGGKFCQGLLVGKKSGGSGTLQAICSYELVDVS